MTTSKEEINEAIAKIAEEYSSELGDFISNVLENVFSKGLSTKDAIGMSDASVEALYAQAYKLYNAGKYNKSSDIFRILIVLDPKEPKYLLGFAACCHMNKDYENAAKIYTNCSLIDPENPVPCYHAADCFKKLNDDISAIVSLEMAIERSGEKQEFSLIKERCKITLQKLKEKAFKKGVDDE